jgi:hypothetical protein
MALPKRTIRGVQNIRTLAGKVDIFAEPYRAYMQITTLEMEKARRGKERESATRRVREIDARFQEIEKEKASLLKGLARKEGARRKPSSNGEMSQDAPCRQAAGGFKITY